MGLILDTDVLIRAEKQTETINFARWQQYEEAFICAITCSELLVGVHLANTAARRLKRAAYVETVLAHIPILAFDEETARVHAQLMASIGKSVTLGAHDLLIGATALQYDHTVLTANIADFKRMPGLKVELFKVNL